jgi:hypothetical protein
MNRWLNKTEQKTLSCANCPIQATQVPLQAFPFCVGRCSSSTLSFTSFDEESKMNRLHKNIITLLGIIIALLAIAVESPAQSEVFIYGTIHTSRHTYTGPIRWGSEEVMWTDVFNAAKTDDSYEKLVPEKAESESWFSYDWNFGSIWDNVSSHQFISQFGNFKEMQMTHKGMVVIKLKNGGQIEVQDDGNDIGEKVQILDNDLGSIGIEWANIDKIEFLPTPAKLSETFGQPLFGTVVGGRREKYTGYIVWDNDERVSTDKLDGDSDDGDDVSIRFGEIQSIEKRGRGSFVKTKSGRELYLTGSNDVDEDNRGVLVVVPEIGIIKFSWDAFEKVTFSTPSGPVPSFDTFTAPKFRLGTVQRLGDSEVSGRIIYDIDEALDFEMIEGKENGIEYSIPLKNIKRISPKNSDYSNIELTSGLTLLLGEGRDVSDGNAGVLVFMKSRKDPVYVPWRKIDQIIFD